MKIAIDVMGGDFAPREVVLGAKQFLETGEAGLILVGRESEIKAVLPVLPSECEIADTPEFIEMGEPPAQTLRKKKNASVAVAARLVKQGKAAAFVSAGSTGAQMAASLIEIGRVPRIERPAVSVLIPTNGEGGVMVLDVGANVDCKPVHLVQFALMGSAYYERICRVSNPKVGLLNVGSEPGKGNELAKAVYEMMENAKDKINFVGNVEADHMFAGEVHVLVCDGFVGNVLLKTSEGLSELLSGVMKKEMSKVGILKETIGAVFAGMRRYQADSPEYSGAPLLGIAGGSIVCHGKSKAPVIANAISLATKYSSTDVIGLISQRLKNPELEIPNK